MRIRTFATTALLTCLLAMAGGTTAHAADPVPIPAAVVTDVSIDISDLLIPSR